MNKYKWIFGILYFLYGCSYIRIPIEIIVSHMYENNSVLSVVTVHLIYYLPGLLLGIISFIISVLLFKQRNNINILKRFNYVFLVLIFVQLIATQSNSFLLSLNEITSILLSVFFGYFLTRWKATINSQ